MFIKKFNKLLPLLSILIIWRANSLNAQQINSPEQKSLKTKIEFGPEFIWPSSPYANIYTTSINGFFWTQYFKKAQLNINLGITTTFAWGTSLDWYRSNRKNLIYLKTSAIGVGPVIHFNQSIFEIKRFSISATAVAGAIAYNKHFPPGGDIYNFMLRTGIDFGYKMNDNVTLKLGCKWMHVSNGQGSGPHNPYYEGYGLGISLIRYFYQKNKSSNM